MPAVADNENDTIKDIPQWFNMIERSLQEISRKVDLPDLQSTVPAHMERLRTELVLSAIRLAPRTRRNISLALSKLRIIANVGN